MENVQQIINWLEAGKKVALATVIQKQGSALRGIGSKLAVSSEMEISGSVSGGCVESAVVEEALKVIDTGKITTVEYGITDDSAWSVGLACGGKIKVLIQPVVKDGLKGLTKEMILKVMELDSSDKVFCTLTVISGEDSGETTLLSSGKIIFPTKKPQWINNGLLLEVHELERTETSGIIRMKSSEVFADFTFPKPRLVIIGAVHIAIPLVKMARLCGFTTILIDPRKAFASADRFSEVDSLVVEWPTVGLARIRLNEKDFLLALSHDDKLDLPALQYAMDQKVRYIGMLASRQTRNGRYAQMERLGCRAEDLKRIHAPVGLDLGAHTPEEIALSILAEITAFRYGKELE